MSPSRGGQRRNGRNSKSSFARRKKWKVSGHLPPVSPTTLTIYLTLSRVTLLFSKSPAPRTRRLRKLLVSSFSQPNGEQKSFISCRRWLEERSPDLKQPTFICFSM